MFCLTCCRFLHDETVTFQSISTARSTLDVAHQYLCPELAHLAVDYLNENLKPSTVLEVYQGLSLYASDLSIGRQTSIPVPTAPPAPEDHAGEIGKQNFIASSVLLINYQSITSSTLILPQTKF